MSQGSSKKQKIVPQIFVSTDNGTITIENDNLTAKQLNQEIFNKTNIPQKFYYLVYGGSVIDPRKTLEDYNIYKDQTISMVIRHPKLNKPVLERAIGGHKWDSAIKTSHSVLKPVLVEVDYLQNNWYIYCPNGNRYQGKKEIVEYEMGLDGYSFDEIYNINKLYDVSL